MVKGLINANPVVYERKERPRRPILKDNDEATVEPIDQLEVFDVRDIKDPEHPYSLEELKVVSGDAIEVNDAQSHVRVTFTPTVMHCSMATVIGLCIRVKLMRSLPSRYKVIYLWHTFISVDNLTICLRTLSERCVTAICIDIRVAPGTHSTEDAVNKQLNDKERVAAALENQGLVGMVDECLAPTYT